MLVYQVGLLVHIDEKHRMSFSPLSALQSTTWKSNSLKFPQIRWIPQLKMPGRTRPIEKFAEAVAKCSAEVSKHL